MTKDRLVVEPAANQDVDAAVGWYESEEPGLGICSAQALVETYDRILEHPLLYQDLGRGLRKAGLRRFPYAVYFAVEDETIVVTAVLHTHRDPAEWQRRR